MEFDNTFTVAAGLNDVWAFMLDAQEVAPCVPGAAITEVVDETHYKGTVKVKLGAVQMTYRGELAMEADESTWTITLNAKGTEARGSGGAAGTITTRLTAEGDSTRVDIHSTVDVSGRVAQFGRGIMQDVATRLIKEFASCLERKIADRGGPGSTEEPNVTASTRVPSKQPEAPPPLPPTPPASNLSASHGRESTGGGAELKAQDLVVSILRSRTAAGLRRLAELVEPE